MKNTRAKVATGVTVVLLGGLTGVALSQGGSTPSKPVADKPIVQTKVIRQTVHVTKHAKPKHPPAAAPVEPAASGTAAGSASVATGSSGASETTPISTSSSGGGESAPVTTATSGGGGGGEVESDDDGGGEVEHEGGDD